MTATLLCRASDPEWLELRKTGITATDIAVITGLVGWDSPWCLYWRKRGLLPEVEQTDRMRLGLWLQDALAFEWVSRHTREGVGTTVPRLFASTSRPWQMATPDLVTRGGEPLEVKTSASRDGWGDDGSDQVPAHVRAQVLWQMDVLDVAQGHVAVVFLPSGEFRSYTIIHEGMSDPGHDCSAQWDTCRDIAQLRAAGLEFRRRLQGELPPPDPDGLAITTAGLKRLYADPQAHLSAELPAALVEAWDDARGDLAALRAAQRGGELLAREAENKLREAMGEAMTGTVDGRPVIERRFGKRQGYSVPPLETDQLKRLGDTHD